ncbi:MAG TPA: subclass B1 metallo-beta-lactamase [Dysgonomonas sp.]|nr:subclass B1 metallo-beta-lactamase [Dysgonomonas sp.]
MKTRTTLIVSFLFFFVFSVLSQNKEIQISEKLKLIPLTENIYLHTGDNNNGIIYYSDGEAVIVSTPESERETQNIIDWVKNNLKADITGYIIDRWHPDAMGGLASVHRSGIKSYANERTRIIAKDKKLPVPQSGFDERLELKVGNKKVICDYFGASHTEDGIVVWIPEGKVLFGGNGVRNYGGWYGNIGDANLKEWSKTISRVKAEYADAEIVIPGHGNYGGTELLDYTIDLYKPNKWGKILKHHNIETREVFNEYGDIFETADSVFTDSGKRHLYKADVFLINDERYIRVQSPVIVHEPEKKMIFSDKGCLQIYNIMTKEIIEDLYFNQLYVNFRDDEVGWTIIIKDAIR